jgi:alanyl-tRNA synthetase
MMLFGEKYGDTVRVLSIGSSKEPVRGHARRAHGRHRLFKIVAEGGVAAGIRRVEAVTGENALAYLQSLERRSTTSPRRSRSRPPKCRRAWGACSITCASSSASSRS